ncbi:PHO85 cyclin-5 [Basidiobolus ranarum]|uniref:PHO85 cyclin-5 n=1 Tax=Basidiobolus ranarum TaxID=34480 RepID=A0ABR2WRY1_9FUNG
MVLGSTSPTEALIDITVGVIQHIWSNEPVDPRALPLRIFIQEVLRRSGASFSTLLVTLIYLFRFKSCSNSENTESKSSCLHHHKVRGSGRRMFVAAIITAFKYLEDRSFPNTRWSRITGLSVQEINSNERIFLELLNYRLYMAPSLFTWWMTLLLGSIEDKATSFSQVETKTSTTISHTHHIGVIESNDHHPTRFRKNHAHFLPYQNPKVRS